MCDWDTTCECRHRNGSIRGDGRDQDRRPIHTRYGLVLGVGVLLSLVCIGFVVCVRGWEYWDLEVVVYGLGLWCRVCVEFSFSVGVRVGLLLGCLGILYVHGPCREA